METNEIKKNGDKRKYLIFGLAGLMISGAIIGVIYWYVAQNRIHIDKAEILAPQIEISASAAGTLEDVMVKTGDFISSNTPVARVGDQLIKSDQAGIVVNVNNNLGTIFNPGQSVVSIINPGDLRVVGHIAEDKGLKDIKIGQRVIFSVDAYSGENFFAVIDEISQTSNNTSVVFSISDKRAEKEFDIKARFNINDYPELKNGMSAKMWVYIK